MANRTGKKGTITGVRPLRGVAAYGKREYTRSKVIKPRLSQRREAPEGLDPLEQRAAAVEGSILERIVYKRMEALFGPNGVRWTYKYQVGVGGAKNARAFVGGIEMDFVYFSHPSGREMDIEVQGAQWHRSIDWYADTERALRIIQSGRLYEEILEWEILMGDEYLDNRILELTGEGTITQDYQNEFPEVQRVETGRSIKSR